MFAGAPREVTLPEPAFHVKQEVDAAGLGELAGCTPEQRDRLDAFVATLLRWQPRINLVGAATLPNLWRRHILDSAQLVPLLPPGPIRLADLGSGAGFPGLVLAILSEARVTLVESDRRKCAFLAEAARAAGVSVDILPVRIESTSPGDFDMVTARALAPLPQLLEYASNWLAPQGICLFLKGSRVASELTEAGKTWKMRVQTIPSRSDPTGVILYIDHLSRCDAG